MYVSWLGTWGSPVLGINGCTLSADVTPDGKEMDQKNECNYFLIHYFQLQLGVWVYGWI